MSLIDAAQNRSRTFISILVLLLIAGTSAFITIPKEANPDINIPIIYVSLSHQGISPEDAERLLVRPVEAELRGIEGVKEMTGTAFQGGGSVTLEFDAGFNSDTAVADVREAVDLARSELPDDANEPTVNEVNLSLFPVLVVTLSGDVPERVLQHLADDLQTEIESLGDILRVNISGARDDQLEIIIDPSLLEVYEIDTAALITNLARSNRLIAAGSMQSENGSFAVKVPGLFEDLEDIVSMPVLVRGDAVVTVGDLATVRSGFEERNNYARINGQPAISLDIIKRTGSNIIDTTETVRELVEARSASWPTGVEVTFGQDQSDNIRTMLTDLQNNVLSAILLVLIVILAVLGVRGGLLVALAIPGSFLTAILVLSILGLTVNVVVLFALILSVGMLVDGAIVVNEYADRKLREGEPPSVAYTLAAKRMAWPIITSTATTLAAFLPLMFWPDLVGEFMKFLPLTLIAVLSASLAMALLFVPVVGANLASLARIFITVAFIGAFGGIAGGLVSTIGSAIGLGVFGTLLGVLFGLAGAYVGFRLGRGVARRAADNLSSSGTELSEQATALAAGADFDLHALSGGTGLYVRVLDRALQRPGLVLLGAFGALIFSWGAYGILGKGVEFFPDIEPDQVAIQVHARGNLSVNEKASLVAQVEREVMAIQEEHHEFQSIYTVAGLIRGEGGGADIAEDVIGNINLEFVDWEFRRPAVEIIADVFARTRHIPGIIIEGREQEQGPGSGKPIVIQVGADSPDLIEPTIAHIREFMDDLDGLKDIEDSRPIPGIEWQIEVDRAQAAKFGADVALVGSAIQFVTNGVEVSEFRPDGADDEVDIVARFPEEYRNLTQMDQVRITTQQGLVPIGSFITRTPVQQTGILSRSDGTRIMTIKSDVESGILVNDKVQEIEAWIASQDFDSTLDISFRGENEDQANAQAFLQNAFGIALFLMAVILVTQFNSFYSAALILSAVIMSTLGVMLGLLIVGQPFGIVMSGIGVIALAGIVVNNNIVLIDTFDRLKKTVTDQREAILRTGAQRLRPVMLTTVTTILGLMPMVLQINIDFFGRTISQGAPSTQWWVQLSTAIVAGLSFATILTLVVTPSALMFRANFQARRAARKNPDLVAAPAE